MPAAKGAHSRPWPLPDGLSPEALRTRSGLKRLDTRFLSHLRLHYPDTGSRLRQARRQPPGDPRAHSALLIDIAIGLEAFLAEQFGIAPEIARLRQSFEEQAPLQRVKYKFVKRQALLGVEPEARAQIDPDALRTRLSGAGADPDDEAAFSAQVLAWQEQARKGTPEARDLAREYVQIARDYAAWAAGTDDGRHRHHDSVVFRHPQPLEPARRVALATSCATDDGATEHRIAADGLRRREGFALTDDGGSLARGYDEARYCLSCHRQGNDTCRHGITREPPSPDGSARFAMSPFGEALGGCPLEERISEFLLLKQQGHSLAAFAMIVLDNPMVAATGHRICNDCSKACVFQQQTPVDIPRAETRTLREVLELPWGVELYHLLLNWNPLNLEHWLPAPPTGRRVLVVGTGPAGFTFAHEMLRRGHQVVAIDGLKIEPDDVGEAPILDFDTVREPLQTRIAGGFGGVAEYGITVRWDKNYLRLIRLLLERHPRFTLFGGVRLGSTLTLDDAWALGFDHVALAIGAGQPTTLDIPGGLANGVRTASDFLMALQLTGAARSDSLANLSLDLPVVVVGGGLTAIDTATEARAYYAVQVEKILRRQEALEAVGMGPPRDEDQERWLDHARALRAAPSVAARHALIEQWGGVTIAYRKPLAGSPAYRLNPEELEHALAEGIRVVSDVTPVAVQTDSRNRVCALQVLDSLGRESVLPAKTVLVAAGTRPNTVLAHELTPPLPLRDGAFARADGTSPGAHPKDLSVGFFCLERDDGRAVSMLGDAHPAFAGNVVSAMASARRAAPVVDARLRTLPAGASRQSPVRWRARLARDWSACVDKVSELAPGIVELVVHAPAAARRFAPGQFYRLQTFEANAAQRELGGMNTRLATETLAMTGAWVDRRRGRIALIILEMGGTADLVRYLRQGDPVVLMGPTGTPTEIGTGQTVLLIGGGLGNAVLFSIGAAMRAAGNRVLYIAGYRHRRDRFHAERIEAAADNVIWCCDEAPGFSPRREQDAAMIGSVVDAIQALVTGGLANTMVAPASIDRLLVIGSDRMMAAVADLLRGPLAGRFAPSLRAEASVNSPMQCMMKAICGQCVQRQQDPTTGEQRVVFTCACQDQPLMAVDFGCLASRLAQNEAQERLAAVWQAALLDERPAPAHER